ncbi:MAG TPA: alkaline phosphatase family protein [Gaiellaceae bacterium]|jgi:predicted AlkP superfamily phosphohydrolase/phosphomutase
MSIRRLLVVGLDAATFDVIDPLVEAGDLPNLAGLLERGARGTLRSTTHPLTPLAWTTMVSGVNAGRHGIWDFSERDASGYGLRLVNGSHSRAPAIWTRLSAAGRKVGVVNVPFTWPAPEVNGFALAGMDAGAREDGMTSPRELVGELQDRFGRLLLDHTFPVDERGLLDLDLVRRQCEQKVAIVDWLAERYDPELLFVVFMTADHVHHLAWPDWEARGRESIVAEAYRILDASLGRLLERTSEDTNVLVVSDHGGGALRGVINLNAWLAEQGYLAYADGSSNGGGAHKVFELRRKLPKEWRYSLKQRLPWLRERAYRLKKPSVVDWSHTRAFAYGIFGNVVLNVAGRERDGVVEPGEEYEQLRNELRERLLDLRSEDGERIVAAVHRREDLYAGPELDRIPDLIIEFRDYAWLGKGNLTQRTPTLADTITVRTHPSQRYAGGHRPDGILVLAGPDARPGSELQAGIADVAPTLMYLLGEPVPAAFEGRLLAEALQPSLLDERPLEYSDDELVAPLDEHESPREVEERLRSLGYLE